ncbi:Hypothetical protein, putative [Bodo saltans]|uniref:C3H1-type domain-containing protein n=1 Tax=Bodo saltans TaxID=75058 RepID=A0A0S4JWC5_BODSA|nr:Hypothetical protein, putative [Bodo saltans]|eukprot:CUG94359.1 Hypothetical protein, putative [Bodo saltans]
MLPVYSNAPPHPQQGHQFPSSNHGLNRARSPVTAIRSPIHDRAPPIQLHDPQTGRMVNVKPSRTTATAAPLHSGGTLCREFLERTGCQAGSYCNSVHVVGREHIWESFIPNVTERGTYVRGFHVSCYDPNMVKYLILPSDTVTPTSGSANYISMFNEHGENFKARFQVCKMMFDVSSCTNGSACSDIHTSLKDFSGVLGQETHVCDEETLPLYRRLPEDVVVRVYQQNSTDDFHEFSGEKVLLTLGAQQYLDAFMNEGRRIPRKKMQHCAHFRLKRLCRMGPGCKFIHVVIDGQSGSTNPLDEDMDSYALASQSSHPRMESPHSRTDSPVMTEVNVIVREKTRGSGYRSPLSVNSRTTSPQLPPSQTQSQKPKMGPADVAAMLAMQINASSGGILTAGSPLIPPSIDSVVAPARSPTRINNPYQQPVSGSSSANSSFSEAKASGGNRPSSGSAHVTSNTTASSPYAPNYANATVHAVPAPPNTADQGYPTQPSSADQRSDTYAARQQPTGQQPLQYQQYQPYPQQPQQQQPQPQPQQQHYSAFPQPQQQQYGGGYPSSEYSGNNAAPQPTQQKYPYQQQQQPQAPQQPYYQGQQQQYSSEHQGYQQQPGNYPSQQQQHSYPPQQQHAHSAQQPNAYQPYPTTHQQQQVYSSAPANNAAYPPYSQYAYSQPQPPAQQQQQQYYQQQQQAQQPTMQRPAYPQQPPNNGQNWS